MKVQRLKYRPLAKVLAHVNETFKKYILTKLGPHQFYFLSQRITETKIEAPCLRTKEAH